MSKPSEERYPLLLLYVEENGKKSEFPQRVVFADKGRGKEVSFGAAAIMNQWPAQITSCWLTAITIGTAFIFFALLLFMTSLTPMSFPVHPRCERDVNSNQANKTIHLVKQGNHWNQKQLDLLRFIAETYPNFKIKNIILETSIKKIKPRTVQKPLTTTTTEISPRFQLIPLPDITSTFVKRLNDIFLKDVGMKNPAMEEKTEKTAFGNNLNSTFNRIKRNIFQFPKSYEDILQCYPNINEEQITYKQYFQNSPLQYFWMDLSPDMVLFSVRVLELWQNGGISFYLPKNHQNQNDILNIDSTINSTNKIFIRPDVKQNDENINTSRLKLLITSTKYRFNKLMDDLVSIDGQGLYMATRTPCHSFFGEMILKLQRDTSAITVSDFIQKVLNTFCGRGAVESDYCAKKKK